MEQNKRKDPEVKKHIATIHSSNQLSLLQRKISNALLFHAYPELMTTEEHEITIKQLCNIIGYSGNNHEAIKNAMRGLLSTVMEWNIIHDNTKEEDWTASTILASVRLKGPLCMYAYSPRMKELLYQPSMYGTINLTVQTKFKSSYGLALYENCVRYRDVKYTKWFDYTVFRKLMGVPKDKYLIYRDFKKRVLDKSVEEVNAYSDLMVQPEIQKQGRAVAFIRFALNRKEQAIESDKAIRSGKETAVSETVDSDVFNTLIEKFGMEETQARSLFKIYQIDAIKEKIEYVLSSSSYKNGAIKTSLVGYLIDALRKDYKATPVTKPKKKMLGKAETVNNHYDSYQKYRVTHAVEKLSRMEIEEKNNLLKNFSAYLNRVEAVYSELYKNEGLTNPLIIKQLVKFLEKEQQDFFSDCKSYDEFCLSLKVENALAC